MNKTDMINAMAERTGQTKAACRKALDAFIEVSKETIETGEKVQITGFINLTPVYRAPRKGFNPNTGTAMDIEETVGLRVAAGEDLLRAVEDLDIEDFRPGVEKVEPKKAPKKGAKKVVKKKVAKKVAKEVEDEE